MDPDHLASSEVSYSYIKLFSEFRILKKDILINSPLIELNIVFVALFSTIK